MENKLQFNPITFPLWWYTTGFMVVWNRCVQLFRYGVKKNALRLFVRHMWHPLYGDYSRSGRIISFFLRIVLLVGKLFFLACRFVFLALFVLFYIVILPFSLFMIAYLILPI